MAQEHVDVRANGRGCIFLDKDGTLLEDVPYNVEPGEMRYAPGAGRALQTFAALGMPLIVVTNQPGVALGRFPPAALKKVETQLRHMFRSCGALLGGFYYCPHHPAGGDERYRRICGCRKPRAGMLVQAAAEHRIDLARSWMIGDILDDVEAGRRAGCRTVLVGDGNESISNRTPLRIPHYIAGDLDDAAHDIMRADARSAPAPVAGFSRLYQHCAGGQA